jgi:hypothetical protein
MDTPRAKFEFELLQHHHELDVIVLRQGEVLFALPLFAGDDHPAVEEEARNGLEGGAFLPRALTHPVVEHGHNRTVVSLHLTNTDDGGASAWNVSLSWSRELRLSSQVTQLSRAAGDAASSVDIISSCKQVRRHSLVLVALVGLPAVEPSRRHSCPSGPSGATSSASCMPKPSVPSCRAVVSFVDDDADRDR